MRVETPDALRTWMEFFEEHVTDDGGPIRMSARFASPAGPWSLICCREKGSYVLDPNGERYDIETLLKEQA